MWWPGSYKAAFTSSCSLVVPLPEMDEKGAVEVVEEDRVCNLLEHAANNDVEAFKKSIGESFSAVNEIGLWYGRRKCSGQMALEQRTPLMVASTYGSLDVLRFILSLPSVDVNRASDPDKVTALHCAAAGGSISAVDVVELLIASGADRDAVDANGLRPADVINSPPRVSDLKTALEDLLGISSIVSDQLRSRSPQLPSPADENGDSPSSEKREYPIDPSFPDIKNSIYASDEFRMFSFKVRPCSRAYSHDWTECPFVHPGENARRRDPRKFHYSCVPCPDFRKGGACARGDLCEYAHGVFECWLHPAQYRTRLCKDGTCCSRRVCFFAHTTEELRSLYVSSGSAAINALLPSSPSSVVPPPFTPPISPSSNSRSSPGWPQPSIPTLHLPGSNPQSSRLRSSFSARDMPVDIEAQKLLNEALCFSNHGRAPSSSSSTAGRQVRPINLPPLNFDDVFSADICSPRFSNEQGGIYNSPTHKSALLNQFQQQQQALLSPINTSVFSPKSVEPHSSLFQASLGISSPGRMSPRGVEPLSPLSSRTIFAHREQQQQLRSSSGRDPYPSGSLGIVGSPSNSSAWSNAKWGSPANFPDWGMDDAELLRLNETPPLELLQSGLEDEEPDVSWVHSLVRESSTDYKEMIGGELGVTAGAEDDQVATVVGDWLGRMTIP